MFLIYGCQTPPPKVDITPASAQGTWEAKALIEDKKKNKANTVALDFVARRPRQMRMEVATQIGIHLASFVLSGERVTYAMTRERRYVTGPAKALMMRELIGVAIEPGAIINLLFDLPLSRDEWDCKMNDAHLPQACLSADGTIRVEWPQRNQHERVVRIVAPNVAVTLALRETQSKVQIADLLFVLEKPEGYRATSIE